MQEITFGRCPEKDIDKYRHIGKDEFGKEMYLKREEGKPVFYRYYGCPGSFLGRSSGCHVFVRLTKGAFLINGGEADGDYPEIG